MHDDPESDYKCKWIDYIRASLDGAGFNDIWSILDFNIPQNWVKNVFNLRIHDMFKQNWLAKIGNNSLCNNYRLFKENFMF